MFRKILFAVMFVLMLSGVGSAVDVTLVPDKTIVPWGENLVIDVVVDADGDEICGMQAGIVGGYGVVTEGNLFEGFNSVLGGDVGLMWGVILGRHSDVDGGIFATVEIDRMDGEVAFELADVIVCGEGARVLDVAVYGCVVIFEGRPWSAMWDVNMDGHVGFTDLVNVAWHFGESGVRADVDGSGVVGVEDLWIVWEHYGEIFY